MKKLLLLFCFMALGSTTLVKAQVFWPTEESQAIASLTPGYSYSELASIDLDQDGNDEVIYADANNNIYGGAGSVLFIYNATTGLTYTQYVSYRGNGFKFGDFNEDGFLDIAYQSSTTLDILLSDDTKTFLATGFYSNPIQVAASSGSFAIGDYDANGNLDIVVAHSTPHSWTAYSGDGLGGFTSTALGLPASWSATSTYTSSIELIDYNGDSNLDIVASGKTSNSTQSYGITVSLGDGAGNFTLASDYFSTIDVSTNSPNFYSNPPMVTDVDSDSKLDIVFTGTFGGNTHILLNNGTSAPTVTTLAFKMSNDYALLDFNGDFVNDIIYSSTGGHYNIMLADGAGDFKYDRSFATTSNQGSRFTTADVDGDADADLAYYDNINNYLYLATLDDGYSSYSGFVGEYALRTETYSDAVLADLDNDGYDELLTLFNDSLAVMMNNDLQWSFDLATYYVTPNKPSVIEAIDLLDDGYPEVIVGSQDASNNNITLFANDGTGTLTSSTQFVAGLVYDMASADMNGDTKPDLVVITSTDILVLLNNGSGGLQSPVSYGFSSGRHLGLGDMNGDGFLDVIAMNSQGRTYLHAGDGAGIITISTDYQDLGNKSGLLVGDFNNDGLADAAGVGYVSNQLADDFKLVLGQTDKLISELTPSVFYSNWAPESMQLADFNGDGNVDIVIDYDRTREVHALFGDGTGSFTKLESQVIAANNFETYAHFAVGDINFDDKQDVVFVRDSRAFTLLNLFEQATEPTVSASNIVVGTPDFNGTSISWDRGNGTSVMMLVAEDAIDMSKLPVDFSLVHDLGINKIAYDGTGTSGSSGALKKNTTYQVGVIEYNGSAMSANYFTSGFPTASFTTPKGTQSITFDYTADVSFINTPYTPTASVNSGLVIGFEVVSGPAEINQDGMVLLIGLGAVTLRAIQAGDNEWDAAIPVEQTFNVIQGLQTISFALGATTYIDYEAYQLPIHSSAGLPISYSLDSGPGSLITDGDTTWYAWAGEGSITLTASQAGNTEFAAAVDVVKSSTISKHDQTITWNRSSVKILNGTITYRYLEGESIQMRLDTLQFNAVSSAGLPVTYIVFIGPGFLKGSGNDSKKYIYTGVGDVTITAGVSGDEVYNSALPVNVNFTIIKGDQTITYAREIDGVSSSNYAYDPDTWVKLNATASSGLALGYEQISGSGVSAIVDDSVNVTTAGNINIALTQPGDDNWNAANQVNVNWSVLQATQTLTFEDVYEDLVVKDTVIALNGSTDSGNEINYQITRNPSSSDVSILNNEFTVNNLSRSGAITIMAYSPGDANYQQSGQVLVDFCLLPATPTLTASGLETSQVILESSNSWDVAEWEKNTSAWNNGASQVQVQEEGIYKVRAHSQDGECPASDWSNEISIVVTQLEGALANLNFYPNPVQTKLILELGSAINLKTGMQVILTGIDGKVVYHKDFNSLPDRKLEIDMNGYKNGIYLIQVINEGKVSKYKIRKQ